MKRQHLKTSLMVFSLLCVIYFAAYSWAEENQNSSKNIFEDTDQDGLGNDEEKTYGTNPNEKDSDGDGYSDGTEIKSGYDPLKKAPGDKVTAKTEPIVAETEQESEEENLTREVSQELSDLINKNVSEDKPVSIDDLDAIIQENVTSQITYEDLPEVDISNIKILKQNYKNLSEEKKAEKEKNDAIEYLTAISYVMINNSPRKIQEPKDAEDMLKEVEDQFSMFSQDLGSFSYFDNFADSANDAFDELLDVEVPEQYLETHIKGLRLLKFASTQEGLDVDLEDPIQSIVKLSKIQGMMALTINYVEEINEKLTNLGIKTLPVDL